MTTKFSISQIHALSPMLFYSSQLRIPAFRKGGWVNGGLCPFHSDNTCGSFLINTDCGAFKCFSCGAKGQDIIAFVRCRYGFNFIDAVNYIAGEWGMYV